MTSKLWILILLLGMFIGSFWMFGKVNFTKQENRDEFTNIIKENQCDIKDDEIIQIGKWYPDYKSSEKFTYVIRKIEALNGDTSSKMRFTIFDESGKELYKHDMNNFNSVITKNVLGSAEQLFLIYDYGGTSFLRGLNYKNNKVIELFEHPVTKDEVSIDGNVCITPQYNENQFTPYQILVTNKIGFTDVYRFKNGKYRLYGSFNQKKLENFIDEITQIEKK